MEIRPQPIVEEQLQLVFAPLRPVEKEELQQSVVEEQPQPIFAWTLMEEKKLRQLVSNG